MASNTQCSVYRDISVGNIPYNEWLHSFLEEFEDTTLQIYDCPTNTITPALDMSKVDHQKFTREVIKMCSQFLKDPELKTVDPNNNPFNWKMDVVIENFPNHDLLRKFLGKFGTVSHFDDRDPCLNLNVEEIDPQEFMTEAIKLCIQIFVDSVIIKNDSLKPNEDADSNLVPDDSLKPNEDAASNLDDKEK